MEDWVPAAHDGVRVQEVLGVGWPEGLVELHEDLGVGSHGEFLDRGLLPLWQGRGELHGVALQDAEGECANCVCGCDAATILVADGHAVLVIFDLGDFGVKVKAGVIVPFQEIGGHPLDDRVETTLISDKVVMIAEDIGSEIVSRAAIDQGAFQGGEIVLEIWEGLVSIEAGDNSMSK